MNRYGEKRVSFVFIIDFELKSPLIFELPVRNAHKIITNINADSCSLYSRAPYNPYNNKHAVHKKVWKDKYMKKFPINFETYNKSFQFVADNQKNGNSYLLNLTFKTPIEIYNFSLEEIFYLSCAKYKLYFKKDDYEFVVFSPESFINIDENNRIFTYPVKGTINAGLKNAEKILMDDDKELAEHITVVDLLRNDLNIISSDVKVNKFRYTEKINTDLGPLFQTVSEIEGKLKANYINKFGDIFLSLLPAGSVSGAPKDQTLEIIKKAELEPRGYYTGVFGYYDGIKNCLKSSVMIRFIENINNKLYYRSGGGITVYSTAIKEYNEMIRKIYVPVYRNS
jgi:para-aminobenzoate synthetase component 1